MNYIAKKIEGIYNMYKIFLNGKFIDNIERSVYFDKDKKPYILYEKNKIFL